MSSTLITLRRHPRQFFYADIEGYFFGDKYTATYHDKNVLEWIKYANYDCPNVEMWWMDEVEIQRKSYINWEGY